MSETQSQDSSEAVERNGMIYTVPQTVVSDSDFCCDVGFRECIVSMNVFISID